MLGMRLVRVLGPGAVILVGTQGGSVLCVDLVVPWGYMEGWGRNMPVVWVVQHRYGCALAVVCGRLGRGVA